MPIGTHGKTDQVHWRMAEAKDIGNNGAKYSLFYFNFHGLGACPRALLCFGGVAWSNKVQNMTEWPTVKPTTPLGTLPVLLETNATTSQVLEIPESGAIERYLARKFSLLGNTPREQTLNDIFYAQAVMLNTKFVSKVVWSFEEVRQKALDQFLESTLPSWIAGCEKHLMDHGNQGHFADDCFTLADIKTAVVLDTMLSLESEHLLNEEKCPGLWKLKRNVDSHPAYAAWRKSDVFRSMEQETQEEWGAKFCIDLQKSHVFS
ncbi:Glutathione S-transferase S1 [Mortierella sp. GBA30]|nr:Glutathione S-transferase S1 [Mortierella sp. GBA30]